ncbi:alkaline phosphatase [Lentisphaerota bacterium ZTH]|nr:alkaline phosphatase [Lentisphaerota bacterium]WET05512.1 alkaline phosphatase [Lentisphaerota bacterium ZTH]
MGKYFSFRSLSVVCLILAFFIITPDSGFAASREYYAGKPVKYVFLFIGDGMALPQRMAAAQFTGRQLLINKFKVQGITRTRANNRFITGSAAAATALANGVKTNINYVGVDPAGRALKSVALLAKEKGRKVGIVTSVSIDHATPAGFYAHIPNRREYYRIGWEMAHSNLDYFAGGGFKDPDGREIKNPHGNLYKIAAENGFKLVDTRQALEKLKPGSGKVFAYNNFLTEEAAMPYSIDKKKTDISLAEFTRQGIRLLDNPEGFFMMVEGGKIDWACHANDGVVAIRETIAFDNAVRAAYKFAEKHPKDTLIIVTGDHETGGMSLGFAGTHYDTFFNLLQNQKISFKKFTDKVLQQYRKDHPAAADYAKFKPIITRYFGLKFTGDPKLDRMVLTADQQLDLKAAYDRALKDKNGTVLLDGKYDPVTVEITHILNNKAGMAWTSYSHTGVPVLTTAYGVGAGIFAGAYENSDIAKKIMSVMGVKPEVHYMNRKAAAAAQ